MKKKGLRTLCCQPIGIIVLSASVFLTFPDLSWSKPDRNYPPDPFQAYRYPRQSLGVDVSRRQQGPPQMDENMQRNWNTYQGLSPDDKARLRDKSRKWQSLPPEEKQEMRQRMERYRELPPQDQERYQKRYQQWQSLPPEDRNRIRDRLRHWDNLLPSRTRRRPSEISKTIKAYLNSNASCSLPEIRRTLRKSLKFLHPARIRIESLWRNGEPCSHWPTHHTRPPRKLPSH